MSRLGSRNFPGKYKQGGLVTTMGDIHIYQIYYSEQTQRDYDRGFIGLDNLANERPDWSEYWPIRNYLLNNSLNEDDFYGFFSPKFKEKTKLDASTAHEFVRKHADKADVILFSPFFDHSAFSQNLFEHAFVVHNDIMDAIQGSVDMIVPGLDLKTLVMDSRNIVFCNYFVAKPAFWKVWFESCERIFSVAEENRTTLGKKLNAATSHGEKLALNKVFVIERVASLLLSTQYHWRVKAYNPATLPWTEAHMSRHPSELIQLDALKMARASQGYAEYILQFSKIRQSIIDDFQRLIELKKHKNRII